MKQKRQVLWYLVALGFIILFVLMLLSSVLEVGDRLAQIHLYVSYAFYVLVFLIVYILLLRPINIIAFKKPLRLHLDKEALELKDYQKMKSILLDLPYVTDELKTQLKEAKTIETLPTLVDDTMNKVVKKEVMNIIKTHAKTVMISTAISQNGRLDFLTVVFVNIKMISKIVEAIGFRPSYPELAKLIIQVMTTALVAEGLENIDLNDVLPQQTLNSIGEIPFFKPILSSTTQGISNALLTLRMGIVTREFLVPTKKSNVLGQVRKIAFLEAAALTPLVVAEALTIFPKTVFNLFKSNKAK
jgi:uncharacterized membrane protein YcjF (UPF0283 family)